MRLALELKLTSIWALKFSLRPFTQPLECQEDSLLERYKAEALFVSETTPMCHASVYDFTLEILSRNLKDEIHGSRILEVGSKYTNGSIRPALILACKPREYVGVDFLPGTFVDVVLPCEEIVKAFGKASFDVVVATEFLEHVENWRVAIFNLKSVLKPGGIILLTTRSKGFPYHPVPVDCWRYEISDFQQIFSDFQEIYLGTDPEAPGIFYVGKKGNGDSSNLDGVALYSMLLGRRTKLIPKSREQPLIRRIRLMIFNRTEAISRRLLRMGQT